MQHTISQSIRIHRYILLFGVMYQVSMYASHTPHAPMPHSVGITIPSSLTQVLLSPAQPLSRSVSQGNFKGYKKQKHKKATHANQVSAGQSHDNSANTINDFSINVASVAKSRTWNNKLAVGASALMLAGLGAVLYLQVRITNQAEQIGTNTGSLDGIGDRLDKSAEQIAGGIITLDTIMQLLLNLTRKG